MHLPSIYRQESHRPAHKYLPVGPSYLSRIAVPTNVRAARALYSKAVFVYLHMVIERLSDECLNPSSL
jgi:hypothetical protein